MRKRRHGDEAGGKRSQAREFLYRWIRTPTPPDEAPWEPSNCEASDSGLRPIFKTFNKVQEVEQQLGKTKKEIEKELKEARAAHARQLDEIKKELDNQLTKAAQAAQAAQAAHAQQLSELMKGINTLLMQRESSAPPESSQGAAEPPAAPAVVAWGGGG
eukprot:9479554-Pyramimonas_sp.AAC.2